MTRTSAASICLLALLGGCVYLPHTTVAYDAECGILERRMTLQLHQVGYFARCQNEGCAELLVLAGAVSAVSAVISGSVVVAGKMVYWLEKQGRCINHKHKPGSIERLPPEQPEAARPD